MGRRNGTARAPQRSHLPANKEARSSRANLAFTLFRPVAGESGEQIYERLHALQQEDDIPQSVHLFNRDHHNSLIQERRMRKGLVMGFAAGFAVSTALGHLESGLPGRGRGRVTAKVKSVSVLGRNRNILVANIVDQDEILERSRRAVSVILSDMGLRIDVDHSDHVTLGTSKSGMTPTESRHVEHVTEEVLLDVPIKLEPVAIEYHGRRLPLSEAQGQLYS